MPRPRLQLHAIEASLRAVQHHFERINERLSTPRDAFTDEVVASLVRGYRYLDQLQAEDVDLLARGSSARLLHLNCSVICGMSDARPGEWPSPFRETERRFYDDTNPGGVRQLMNYVADHPFRSPWRRAAGVYVQAVSTPQLFFEGNHRTGALLMSHILLRHGEPPFVIDPDTAQAYLDLSSLIKVHCKQGLFAGRRAARLQNALAGLLQAGASARYLLPQEHQPSSALGAMKPSKQHPPCEP